MDEQGVSSQSLSRCVFILAAVSGAKMLKWRVAPDMYNGCVRAGLREFPPVSPVRLMSAGPKC